MTYLDVAAYGCFVILCFKSFVYRSGKIPLDQKQVPGAGLFHQNFRVTYMGFMQKCQVVIEFVSG